MATGRGARRSTSGRRSGWHILGGSWRVAGCIRRRAALRISFGGGGTDVAPYPERRGGCVLSATIDKYAYVTLVPRTDQLVRASSLDVPQRIETDVGNLEYDGALDLVKAALRHFHADQGCELVLQSD